MHKINVYGTISPSHTLNVIENGLQQSKGRDIIDISRSIKDIDRMRPVSDFKVIR